MSKHLLILRDDPNEFQRLSPAEMQAAIQRYTSWAEGLGERHLGGQKLADGTGAATLRAGAGETVVTDGPFGESKEIVSGFFLIEADDLAHARELCRDHPHLEAGTIEVRQVAELADCAASPGIVEGSRAEAPR